MPTFWIAVSLVKGGTGGRDSFALFIESSLLDIKYQVIARGAGNARAHQPVILPFGSRKGRIAMVGFASQHLHCAGLAVSGPTAEGNIDASFKHGIQESLVGGNVKLLAGAA